MQDGGGIELSQVYFLEPFPHGGVDSNSDGTVTLRAMQCEGGFTEVDGAYTEGTFFIGVACKLTRSLRSRQSDPKK